MHNCMDHLFIYSSVFCLDGAKGISILRTVHTLSSVSLPLCGFERATEDVWLLLYTEQPNDDDDCTSGSAGTMNYYLLCKDVEIMIR